MSDKTITQIIDAINSNERFFLSSHIRPEGDALGSQLALLGILEAMNKEVVIVNAHPVPERYKFLPNNDRIINSEEYNIMTQGKGSIDVVFILDCPSVERIGDVERILPENYTLINIDHHASNSYYADINYVDSDSSSTCQMLFELFKNVPVELDKSVAVNLYTGILTDTGDFNYSNTSSRTHLAISELLSAGVRPYEVHDVLYGQWPIERFRLLAKVLDSIETEFDGRYASIVLSLKMAEETASNPELSEDFINYCMSICKVEVATFFIEDLEHVKVTFRSKSDIDVNRLASKYGGGGHVKASGCRIEGKLDEVKEKIKADIGKALGSN